MNLPYSEELNIENLGRLFDNTSECYKFFWFKSIISKITDEHKTELTFDELVNDMITAAWYMVTEYHLNLGPSDTLESVVQMIKHKSPKLKSNEKKSVILSYLENCNDKDILQLKRTLTYNGLSTKIFIQEDWARYIEKNKEIIEGWLEYKLILYLQRRNPSVPGIADKLYPPQERKLDKVKKYWKLITSLTPIHDIYGQNLLMEGDLSIDHFIPWSYVAHDELWNLNPTTRSINSSKSNNLPDWDIYFDRLATQEFQAYQLMWENDTVHDLFRTCAKDHLNNNEIKYHLYRGGLEYQEFAIELEKVILPVYQSAQNCGFSTWKY